MQPQKFRKKPVVVEAMQWDNPGSVDYMRDWGPWLPQRAPDRASRSGDCLVLKTLEGTMFARPGDWIIKGVAGEFYPCKPDIFEATYEPIKERSDDKNMAEIATFGQWRAWAETEWLQDRDVDPWELAYAAYQAGMSAVEKNRIASDPTKEPAAVEDAAQTGASE